MNSRSDRRASMLTQSGLGLLIMLACLAPQTAMSEWYVAGYGGASAPTALKNVKLNQLGETQDTQFFSGGQSTPKFGTYTQTLRASDLNLKQSPLFGGKVGYFFADEGVRWLGVEFEAFTTEPTIKKQTVNTVHDISYVPFSPDSTCVLAVNCQRQVSINGRTNIPESSMRLFTMAFNVVARYPGTVFQPYAGVGAGAFYFTSSGAIAGHQVVPGFNAMAGIKVLATEEWGFFLEGKFNRATITNFDRTYGLSGEYSAINVVAGLAYHF